MFPSLLALTVVTGVDQLPPPAKPPKAVMPRLTDVPAPLKPLSILNPAVRPVPSNTVPSAESLNITRPTRAGTGASANRLPPFVTSGASPLGHAAEVFEWHFGQITDGINRQRFDLAVTAEQQRLRKGESKQFILQMAGDGQGRPVAFVRLVEARRTPQVLPATPGQRSFPLTHRDLVNTGAVTLTRDGVFTGSATPPSLPSMFSGDHFAEARLAQNVAGMKSFAERRGAFDKQRLGYDRVRSLITPAGPDAVSTLRPSNPQIGPPVNSTTLNSRPELQSTANRGLRVYETPIGPKPAPAWHPPMAAQRSTPLP